MTARVRQDGPAQIEIEFHPSQAAREVWKLELEWARRAVLAIGAKDVVFYLDIAASTLSEALSESPDRKRKKPKGLRAEWLRVIVMMSSPVMREEWLRIVSRPMGFVVARHKNLTPEQRLAAQRRVLERIAPGVLEMVDQEVGD